MITIEVPASIADPAMIMSVVGPLIEGTGIAIGGDGFKLIVVPAVNVGVVFPTIPDVSSIRVRVSQICPGYPACGRKSGACQVSKTTPAADPFRTAKQQALSVLPAIPSGFSFHTPEISFSIRMPKLGFSLHCPNSQQPVVENKSNMLVAYAHMTDNPPQDWGAHFTYA